MSKCSRAIQKTGIICLIMFVMAALISCNRGDGNQRTGEAKIKVVTSLYPLYDFAKNIGRDKVEVILLMPPGVEPHSFEPKPADVVMLNNADLFVYTNKYMEPWADKIIMGLDSKKTLVVDSSKGLGFIEEKDDHGHHESGDGKDKHEHGDMDPHIWLDPINAIRIVANIAEGLMAKDQANREYYRRNADEYKARLMALDADFRKGLADCSVRKIVSGGHMAFSYLAKRYSLTSISAYGFSPDAEPTPGQLIRISNLLKKEGIKYIFYEEMLMPRVAEAISKETGARLLYLSGIHNISREEFEKGISFVNLMGMNLENLRKGLQCR
jgi:zinc transport system substrate-binding protein